MLVCYAIILIINDIGLAVDSFSIVSFLWNGNWNAQKYMAPQKWLQDFMQPPFSGVQKGMSPPHLHQPNPPSNK